MSTAPLPASPDPSPGPQHVAIIMDGNGRWAKARGLPRVAGHRRGAESVRRVIRGAGELGIPVLTLFAFSTENWARPADEVSDLMGLLRQYLRNELEELGRNGARLRVIGDRERLAPDIVRDITDAENRTRANTRIDVNICINYGSRDEILRATRSLARRVAAGELAVERIDEACFERELLTAGVPDPDLLIRTSGEQRISNFLLWQCAYAELVFVDTLWPDFGKEHLEQAIAEFRRRERRYGGDHPVLRVVTFAYSIAAVLALLWLRHQPSFGRETILWIVACVWATDIGAYFVGSLAGGAKLAPTISPGKTWSGLVGGMCFAAVASAACGLAFDAGDTPTLALTGIAIAAVAQAGDLFESAAKRRAGVKDSGRLIPGHGGLLDRIDGLIAALVTVAAMRLAIGGEWPWL